MPEYTFVLATGGSLTLNIDEGTAWEALAQFTTEGISLLTSTRKLVPMTLLQEFVELNSAKAASETLQDYINAIPDAVLPRFRGVYQAGLDYAANDYVTHQLADGRTGAWVAVTSTTTVPGGDDWQLVSLPAPSASGGTAATGVTKVSLAAEAGTDYPIDLAGEKRFLITRDAAKTISFINEASLGYAVLAIKAPPSGTIHPLSFAATETVVWEGDPPSTNSAGRGDIALARSWDGKRVLGRVTQRNVFFEPRTVTAVAGTNALWHFFDDETRLQNLLNPGTNDFVFNNASNRALIGINVAAQTYLYTGAIAGVDWNGPWTLGFVVSSLPASQPASGFGTLFAVSSTTVAADYAMLRYPSGNLQAWVRDDSPTFNLPVAAADTTEAGSINFKTTNVNAALNMVLLEYDGAGQFQVRDIRSGTIYTIGDAVTEPANRFPGKVTTNIKNYANGRVNFGVTWRANSTALSPHIGATIQLNGGFVAGKAFTLTERNQQYNIFRDMIATVDPTGPQLPALV